LYYFYKISSQTCLTIVEVFVSQFSPSNSHFQARNSIENPQNGQGRHPIGSSLKIVKKLKKIEKNY